MTTIAVSLARMTMAADSRMFIENSNFKTGFAAPTIKLLRAGGWILGGAGNGDDISKLMTWWQDKRTRRPKVDHDAELLALSRTKLFLVCGNGAPEEVRAGFHAVGTGAHYAMASMTTQVLLGHDPDPRIAAYVACQHDIYSCEPIDFLSWKNTA